MRQAITVNVISGDYSSRIDRHGKRALKVASSGARGIKTCDNAVASPRESVKAVMSVVVLSGDRSSLIDPCRLSRQSIAENSPAAVTGVLGYRSENGHVFLGRDAT